MTYIFALSKSGSNVLTNTNPNNFIFHSNYNTFKIISSGTTSFTMNGYESSDKTFAHNLSYTPLVSAFCKINTYDYASASDGGIYYMVALQWTKIFDFFDLKTNQTNIVFSFYNGSSSSITVYVKYYIYEVPL